MILEKESNERKDTELRIMEEKIGFGFEELASMPLDVSKNLSENQSVDTTPISAPR